MKKKYLSLETVYAQIGYSTYEPKHYPYKQFLNKDEFMEIMDKSNIIITHGGTGSIINAVKQEKIVIGVPRKREFNEHVDNHQLEILEQFSNSKLIYAVSDTKEIENALEKVKDIEFRKYQSNTMSIIRILEDFLETIN